MTKQDINQLDAAALREIFAFPLDEGGWEIVDEKTLDDGNDEIPFDSTHELFSFLWSFIGEEGMNDANMALEREVMACAA